MKKENLKKGEAYNPFDNVEETLSSNVGNWEVTNEGKLIYQGSAIAAFEKGELYDPCELDVVHYMSKVWTDYKDCHDFFIAYLNAMKIAGLKSLVIDTAGHFTSSMKK